MIICPKCNEKVTLKEYWKKNRLDGLLEWQAKFVANNVGLSNDPRKEKKYKQSERLIRKCGFYDDLSVKEV